MGQESARGNKLASDILQQKKEVFDTNGAYQAQVSEVEGNM